MQMTLHRQDCAQVLYTPFSNLSIVIVIVIVSTVHSILKPHQLLTVISNYSQSEAPRATLRVICSWKGFKGIGQSTTEVKLRRHIKSLTLRTRFQNAGPTKRTQVVNIVLSEPVALPSESGFHYLVTSFTCCASSGDDTRTLVSGP